jgi:exodeoxyribonuclease VII large subunit
MSEEPYTISRVAEMIKGKLGQKIKVVGEVSQPKLSNGNLYFSLKEESASVRAILWKFNSGVQREQISEGAKLTCLCKIDFYAATGTVSLIVEKIISEEGDGELFKKYELVKRDFEERGYFAQEHKLTIPGLIKKILILTSESGAALRDFIFNLDNQGSLVEYDLRDVKVQGVDCPRTICQILDSSGTNDENYDLVVITRGGGSFEELFGFSQPELIESVYKFGIPILSAIGHQVDHPLLDLVADYSAPTPSLASQFIVDWNKHHLRDLHNVSRRAKQVLLRAIQEEKEKLLCCRESLEIAWEDFKKITNRLRNSLCLEIRQEMSKLSNQMERVSSRENIQLFYKTMQVQSPLFLENLGNETPVQLKWGSQTFDIIILKSHP